MDEKKCLLCENVERSRGLCITHYSRFAQAKNALPKEKQAEFEQMLIARKFLCPSRPRGPKVERDEFAEVAAEIAGTPRDREIDANEEPTRKRVERIHRKTGTPAPKSKSKSKKKPT